MDILVLGGAGQVGTELQALAWPADASVQALSCVELFIFGQGASTAVWRIPLVQVYTDNLRAKPDGAYTLDDPIAPQSFCGTSKVAGEFVRAQCQPAPRDRAHRLGGEPAP